MDKLKALLQKLGIELTADQTKQIEEVMSKEFIPAADAAADKTRLDETNFVASAATVMDEFQRTKVIPEAAT